MAAIYSPTRSEERTIGRIHRKLRKIARRTWFNPRIGDKEKDRRLDTLRFANRIVCAEGPDKFRELVGEANYARLLHGKQGVRTR